MLIIAYLDAGSGSLILQALVAGLAGVAVFARYRWNRVMQWFRRNEGSEQER